MTWWKREEPATPPEPGLPEVRRQLAEAQSDITLLYDQLERINNRLKQRASRTTRIESDDSGDRGSGDDGGNRGRINPAPLGDATSSSSLAVSTFDPVPGSLTKDQVRDLWRRQHHG